jgi:hypothetical protein
MIDKATGKGEKFDCFCSSVWFSGGRLKKRGKGGDKYRSIFSGGNSCVGNAVGAMQYNGVGCVFNHPPPPLGMRDEDLDGWWCKLSYTQRNDSTMQVQTVVCCEHIAQRTV